MNGTKVYKIKVGCVNCLNLYDLDIDFGKLAQQVLPNVECKYCGNKLVLTQVKPQEVN